MTTLLEHPVAAPGALSPEGPGAPEHGRDNSHAAGSHATRPSRLRALLRARWGWLGIIAAAQFALTRLVPQNATAFQDEGLYIYMGHRILDHLAGREPLFEFPGSYFSGAPGFYPVVAALVDQLGGLQAVRDLSLVFTIVTMVATHGIASQLFGRIAGVFAAAVFAVCGAVVYISQWATFDAMTLMLASLATWFAVWSTKRDGLLAAPVVALLLAATVFAKYAGAMYVPIVAALVIAVGWQRFHWVIVRRAIFLVAAASTIFFFVLMLFGRGMLPGLVQTTTERHILNPASPSHLIGQVAAWVGPWLVLALLAGLMRLRSNPAVVLVLLGGSVLGPLQQIHIGEATSLRKHVAFGLIFAAPLIGDLFSRMVRSRWRAGLIPLVVAATLGLTLHGSHFGGQFLTAYPDDAGLQRILRQAVAANPGKPILAEQSSAQRYEMRSVTHPRQWVDTYVFNYEGQTGPEAYRRAIRDHYFGVIYLNFTTTNSHEIVKMLGDAQGADHYYHLVGQVPGHIGKNEVGSWLIWTPQTKHYTAVR